MVAHLVGKEIWLACVSRTRPVRAIAAVLAIALMSLFFRVHSSHAQEQFGIEAGVDRTTESGETAGPTLRNDILPLLAKRCGACHSRQKRSGQLNLSSAVGLALGGESGAAIEPGNVEESWLWERIVADEMPPDAPLPGAEKELLLRWIAAGAPGLPELEDRSPGADHWAFQPPQRPAPPRIEDDSQIRSEVDRFIVATLSQHGLALSPEADRATLVRRVSFDLTGLPPSPEQIADYLADPAPGAYERMVDRYLDSPHYGERWGKHWLDAMGYADSNGYFHADTNRPLAYKYRDYVVGSTNADKPLDRFVQEQLAGDELAGYRPGGDITPEMVELLTATHMLRNSQDGSGESDGNEQEVRADRFRVLEGTLEIIGSAFLGVTLQCARCHDHKFEPITQAEYYSLQAILWPGYCPDDWLKPAQRVVEVGTRAQRAEQHRQIEAIERESSALTEALKAFATSLRAALREERMSKLESAVRDPLAAALATDEADRTDEQKTLLETHEASLDVSDDELAERFAEYRETRERIGASIAALESKRPEPLERIAIFTDVVADPPPHHVLVRGDYESAGEEVPAAVPAVLTKGGNHYQIAAPSSDSHTSGRRLALARWLTSSEHPTFARVTVNRIWQHHFGRGLVPSTNNFGYTSDDCSHPALLDYLARELIESGWSLKTLHRLMLGSSTYRQRSASRAEAHREDPDNVLLWRFPLRRLDAESIRDSMLTASGELDRTAGGPYIATHRHDDGRITVADDQPGAHRRSIYLQQRRTQMLSLLDVFDAPSIVTNCTFRDTSTVPLQSLSLLNSEFAVRRAEAMAKRVAGEGGPSAEARIDRAFLLTCGRGPRRDERAAALAFLETQPARYNESLSDKEAEARAWRDFCQMLLASNTFLYVE